MPAMTPPNRDRAASTSKMAPYFKIGCIVDAFPLACTSLTILAMNSGIRHSLTTSSIMKRGARIDCFLYSLTLFTKVFTITEFISSKNVFQNKDAYGRVLKR